MDSIKDSEGALIPIEDSFSWEKITTEEEEEKQDFSNQISPKMS